MADYILSPMFVYSRIGDGDAYLIPSLMQVSANSSVNVHIKNPHEDKVMWLSAMNIIAEGTNYFYIHDDFNSITTGDKITIQNALMDEDNGGPDSGPFEAYENSTFDSTYSYPIGFTTSGGPADSRSIDIKSMAMEPNREMVIELQNQDDTSNMVFFGALVLTSY